MGERTNRFMQDKSPNGVNLRNLTKAIDEPETEKHFKDINVELIDEDPLNEGLCGYEDLNKIVGSFKAIGNDDEIICVYDLGNGRYLCYSGNQRLKASKQRGDTIVTCKVSEGPIPSEDERTKKIIFMNVQREPRAYYIGVQIKSYESILRKEGVSSPSGLIEEQFGIKVRMQQLYKKILTLDPVLQDLFKYADIPFALLLDRCLKLVEGKEKEFAKKVAELEKDDSMSAEGINKIFNSLVNVDTNKTTIIKKPKSSQIFKKVMSLPYYADDEAIEIPEKKKKEILEQAEALEEYARRIKEACI